MKEPKEPEGIVYNYLRSRGASIELGKWYGELGVPDFKVTMNDKVFWVEVKSQAGTLSTDQLIWMSKHGEEEIYIAIHMEVGDLRGQTIFIKAHFNEATL